jgi:hypothetical protein
MLLFIYHNLEPRLLGQTVNEDCSFTRRTLMRASNFRRFKKSLQGHIVDFSIEADKYVSDDVWESPVHRHSAAEILVWILNKTGATLRKSQLVEAWRSIVSKCCNLVDFTAFTEQNHKMILGDIGYCTTKSGRKKNADVPVQDSNWNHSEVMVTSGAHGGTVRVSRATRIRRVAAA